MSKNQRSLRKTASIQFKIFFRKYPALPYVFKWLCISLVIGLTVGSASAGFLISLDWAGSCTKVVEGIKNN